jgi:hypothetical protein
LLPSERKDVTCCVFRFKLLKISKNI